MKKEAIEDASNKESKYLSDWEDKETWKWGFKEGAKWQQERSYSEDELLDLLNYLGLDKQCLYDWFKNQNQQE